MHVAEEHLEILAVKRESGVALIIFDAPSKFNSLGSRTNAELDTMLDKLESDPQVRAIIIISGKPDSYIVGADLVEIRKLTTEAELLALSLRGQKLLNRVQNSCKPIVGAINGTCLGGGLELALAFDYRVATNAASTRLGLPETRLGIIPGLGGTQRLPVKIGLKAALDMILTAESISAEQALAIGLVEQVVSPDDLIAEAEKHALRLADEFETRKNSQSEQVETSAALEPGNSSGIKATPFCRTELTSQQALKLLAITERAIRVRTRGNYPAQQRTVQVIREGLENGVEAGMASEARAFAELAAGDVSSNLMSLFFNADFARQAGRSLVNKFPGSKVNTVAIVGAGKMGTSVAQLAATHGINAIVRTDVSKTAKVQERVLSLARIFGKQSGNKIDPQSVDPGEVLSRLKIVGEDEELAEADLIVECVVEETDAKTNMLERCSKAAGKHAVIASNTSALSISALSNSVDAPERFIGLHFFHPVDKMQLVEVVAHPETSRAALARAVDFVTRIGKTPLMVKDGPGFLVNRLIIAYLIEVARLLEEPTPANWIEEAAIEFGMPIGPLQMMDEVGIDVSFTVARTLPPRLGDRLSPPAVLENTAALNLSGREGNRGFYLWENAEKRLGLNPELVEKCGYVFSPEKCPPAEKERLIDRLFLIMADEAARCLEEKIVSKPREVDTGVVLGIGFPAFRGGVLKYADKVGLPVVLRKLETIYSTTVGNRQVSSLLRKYAESGRSFYSLSGKEE